MSGTLKNRHVWNVQEMSVSGTFKKWHVWHVKEMSVSGTLKKWHVWRVKEMTMSGTLEELSESGHKPTVPTVPPAKLVPSGMASGHTDATIRSKRPATMMVPSQE